MTQLPLNLSNLVFCLKNIECLLSVVAECAIFFGKQLNFLWLVFFFIDCLLKLIGNANVLAKLRPNALSLLSKLGSLLDARPYSRGCCKQGNWVDDITPSLWQC
jgi:hypothetical protein